MFWLIQCWTCHVSFYQCFPELRPLTVHLSALLCAQLLSGLLSVSAFIITALVLSNVNMFALAVQIMSMVNNAIMCCTVHLYGSS